MSTTQVLVITDQLPALTERADRGDAETWTGEWDQPDFTTRTIADGTVLNEPAWPALPPLSMAVSYLLLLPLGVLGAHQFYLRNWWRAGLYLITAGGLGIGLLIDLITIPRQLQQANAIRALGLR